MMSLCFCVTGRITNILNKCIIWESFVFVVLGLVSLLTAIPGNRQIYNIF